MESGTLTWMDFSYFEIRRVNESTKAQLASWEVSFDGNWYDKCDELNVILKVFLAYSNGTWLMENWSLYGFHINLSIFMCSIHLQIDKNSSRVTRACVDLLLPRTCKNLAFACNKTWDDGRREMIGLSSPNTYEKNNKQLLIKQIQRKMNKTKSILYLHRSNVLLNSPTVFW